jgi:hypothetical protein
MTMLPFVKIQNNYFQGVGLNTTSWKRKKQIGKHKDNHTHVILKSEVKTVWDSNVQMI